MTRSSLALACILSALACAVALAEVPLPDLGIAVDPGPDWELGQSCGTDGAVLKHSSTGFAPLEVVAWAAPAKRASAVDAAAQHESLLRRRFRYDRLSFSEIKTRSGLTALRVTGAVEGNDGQRYASLFAAYLVRNLYVVIGTFCKPDDLGRVRDAYFDAASYSVRALLPSTPPQPPVIVATAPKQPPPVPIVEPPKAPPPGPSLVAPSPVASGQRPARGGLMPVIQTPPSPQSVQAIAEGSPVAAVARLALPVLFALGGPALSADAQLDLEVAGEPSSRARSQRWLLAKLQPSDSGQPASAHPVSEPPEDAPTTTLVAAAPIVVLPPEMTTPGAMPSVGTAVPTAPATPVAGDSGIGPIRPRTQAAKPLPPDVTPGATGAVAGPARPVASGSPAAGSEGAPVTATEGGRLTAAVGPVASAGPRGSSGVAVSGEVLPQPSEPATTAAKPLPPEVAATPPPPPVLDRPAPGLLDSPVLVAALTPERKPTPAWRVYQSPYGFRAEVPPDWHIELRAGFVIVAPPQGAGRAKVALCPLWVHDATDGEAVIAAAQQALQHWTTTSGERWEPASARLLTDGVRAPVVAASLSANGDAAGTPMRLAATLAVDKRVGILTVIQDATTAFDASATTLARVAQSFVAEGLPLPTAAAPSGVPYADPTEGAFEVRLPPGWQASGGLKRYGGTLAIDLRLKSADSAPLVCEWRQPYAPAFRDLTSFLKGLGWHEGDLYSANARGEKLVVLKFRSPEEFLRTHLASALNLQSLQVTGATTSADAATLLPGSKAQGAALISTALVGNAPRERTFLLATGEAPDSVGNACWQAAYLVAEAPPGGVSPAAAALAHVVASATIADSWQASSEDRATLKALLTGAKRAAEALVPAAEPQGPIALLGAEASPDAPKVNVPAPVVRY